MHTTPLRRALAAGIGLAAALALTAPVAAAPSPLSAYCTGSADIPAELLTAAPVSIASCDLRGRVVRAGSMAVRVPSKEGTGVTGSAQFVRGTPTQADELTAAYANGAVTVRIGPASTRASTGTDGGAGLNASPECSQNAYSYSGEKWFGTYNYWIRHESTPAYYSQTWFQNDVTGAAWNIDNGYNDCGYAYSLGTATNYKGSSTIDVGIGNDGSCLTDDGYNVIAFGALPSNILAVTCTFWYWVPFGDNHIYEADIRARNAANQFFYTIPSGCSSRYELESVLTHEFGHVFGLNHVSESSYPTMTMSPNATPCSYSDKTLGQGDYNGLKDHYGG